MKSIGCQAAPNRDTYRTNERSRGNIKSTTIIIHYSSYNVIHQFYLFFSSMRSTIGYIILKHIFNFLRTRCDGSHTQESAERQCKYLQHMFKLCLLLHSSKHVTTQIAFGCVFKKPLTLIKLKISLFQIHGRVCDKHWYWISFAGRKLLWNKCSRNVG